MVELNFQIPQRVAGREAHDAALKVNRFDRANVQLRLRSDAANRADDVECFERARDDLGEHRLEDEIVLRAHQDYAGAVALLCREGAAEILRGVDAGKPAAEDDDLRCFGRHRFAASFRA